MRDPAQVQNLAQLQTLIAQRLDRLAQGIRIYDERGFAATIALMAAYWSLWQIGFNLSSTQAIAAPVAAWLANAVFGIGAIYGLRKLA